MTMELTLAESPSDHYSSMMILWERVALHLLFQVLLVPISIVTRFSHYPLHAVPLPGQPGVSTSSDATSVTVSWTPPSSGGVVDSYTLQYRVTVRGCGPPSQTISQSFTSEQRNDVINSLQEGSDVSGSISAVNIRGSTSATFATSTDTTRMFDCTEKPITTKMFISSQAQVESRI